MSKRFKKKKESGGSAGWMTTFADLMSLLLTFFVLLYSMSTVDAVKFDSASASLQSVFSGTSGESILEGDGGSAPLEGGAQMEDSTNMDTDEIENIQEMYEQVSDYIDTAGLDEKVSVNADTRGVYVDINEAILFESGSAALKEGGIEVLKQLEGMINDFDNDIVVEGHTDNVPINRVLYPSNWELSTSRAVSVVRYLSETEEVNPNRLAAIGYGEYRPSVENDTRENRALNRRVNILIVFEEKGEETSGR